MEAGGGGFRGMVGGDRLTTGEIEDGGVVRRRGSVAGHGWRWPVVRSVPAAGETKEDGAAARELEEDWAAMAELEDDGRRRRFEEEDDWRKNPKGCAAH
jgi:hypothetical protein